jgi:hypothetical protein
MLERRILKLIHSLGYEIFKALVATRGEHQTIAPLASYAALNLDSSFARVYGQCRAHTLVDIHRCYEIWSTAAEAAKLQHGELPRRCFSVTRLRAW